LENHKIEDPVISVILSPFYPLPVAWKEREWEMGFKKRAEQFIWEAAVPGPFLRAGRAQ